MPARKYSITVRGIPLIVMAGYDRGFRGTHEQPPEPEGFEVESVRLEENGADIWNLIYPELEDAIIEALFQEIAE